MNNLLKETLDRHRRDIPGRVALADCNQSIDYADLPGELDRRRLILHKHGARVIALDLDNSVDWILWDLAVAFGGLVCVPIPPFFSAAQRAHAFSSAGIDTLISTLGITPCSQAAVELPTGTGKMTFTSGTTGSPKGVCLPFAGLQRVAASILDVLGPLPLRRHFAAMPLAVLLENVAGIYTALLAGCSVELATTAKTWTTPANLLRALHRTRASTVILVPEMLKGLVAEMRRGGHRLPDLEFVAVGGARVSMDLIDDARRMGLPAYEGYGLSECGSVVSLNTPTHDYPGTAGRVLPHIELSIDDGEIVIHDPINLGHPAGQRGDRLYTGDLGAIDHRKVVSVSGRSGHVFVTSWGRNISPEWPEAELLARPCISQVLVYGNGRPRPGALIVADAAITDAAVHADVDAANANLPEYARIADWMRVEPFTRCNGLLTGNGRLRRQRITETHHTKLETTMNRQEFYEELFEATITARRNLYGVPQLSNALSGRIGRDTYIGYLTEAYHHVRHTVPLLMAMGSRLATGQAWLLEPIMKYIDEEKGHEQWILADIDAAGGDSEIARKSYPARATRVMIAYNHDYIQRINPVGFLGMVFMLESTSAEIATQGASSIQQALGLPDSAFSYLYSHGTLDRDHMEFFRELVNRISEQRDRAAILEVAETTFHLFAEVLSGIPCERETRNVA